MFTFVSNAGFLPFAAASHPKGTSMSVGPADWLNGWILPTIDTFIYYASACFLHLYVYCCETVVNRTSTTNQPTNQPFLPSPIPWTRTFYAQSSIQGMSIYFRLFCVPNILLYFSTHWIFNVWCSMQASWRQMSTEPLLILAQEYRTYCLLMLLKWEIYRISLINS